MKNELYTCAVTIAEVVSKAVRKNLDHEVAYAAITPNSHVIEVDSLLSKKAGIEHASIRGRVKDFSLADAYLLACSAPLKATILTGDPHFKDLRNVEMLEA